MEQRRIARVGEARGRLDPQPAVGAIGLDREAACARDAPADVHLRRPAVAEPQGRKGGIDRLGRETAAIVETPFRSEEHTSELQSLMRISYGVYCWTTKNT